MDIRVIEIATQLKLRIRATGIPRTTRSALPLETQQSRSPKIKKSKSFNADQTYKTEDTFPFHILLND